MTFTETWQPEYRGVTRGRILFRGLPMVHERRLIWRLHKVAYKLRPCLSVCLSLNMWTVLTDWIIKPRYFYLMAKPSSEGKKHVSASPIHIKIKNKAKQTQYIYKIYPVPQWLALLIFNIMLYWFFNLSALKKTTAEVASFDLMKYKGTEEDL